MATSIKHKRRRFRACEPLEHRRMLALVIDNVPASEITLDSAIIGGEVLEQNSFNPSVILFWGDEAGGESASEWDQQIRVGSTSVGTYQSQLSELALNTTYYYRSTAIDVFEGEIVWTDVASFRTLPPELAQVRLDPIGVASATSAELAGSIVSTGGDRPTLTVHYGQQDGGEDVENWEHSIPLEILETDDFSLRTGSLQPSSEYIVRIAATNAGGVSWTEPQRFTTQEAPALRFSEVMAANSSYLPTRVRAQAADEFDHEEFFYDWFEIQNTTAEDFDLSNFYVSDSRRSLTKWQVPSGTLVPANDSIVMFASGLDIRDPNLDEQGHLHTNFQISSQGESLSLASPEGDLITEFDFELAQYHDVSYGVYGHAEGYMREPTPGTVNAPIGPHILDVGYEWRTANDNRSLYVTATITETFDTVIETNLHYRVMYDEETTVSILDDGLGPDAVAGDQIYSALIPATDVEPGQMLRFYVSAQTQAGLPGRAPLFVAPEASPEYFGTMLEDPELDSPLPVLHRFVEDDRRVNFGRGTRGSVYYDGEFYDNTLIRVRGGTARNWPKKSYKIEFNEDHHFRMHDDTARVDEINVNAFYTDKSYVRPVIMYDFQSAAGLPSPEIFHVRMHQNGEFFSVAMIVEQPDRDFLRRNGLDPDGALYKGSSGGATYLTSSIRAFLKRTRTDEGNEDLATLLEGLNQTDDAALERFLFDNVDLATQINFMATHVVTQNIDATDKNHYLYRDTNGSGQWHMLPWDLDLVLGPDALNTDYIAADHTTQGVYPNAVHPFLGSVEFPLHAGKINMLMDGVITNPRTQEMFLRRVRTLTDEFLATGWFHNLIDDYVGLLGTEVAADQAVWGNQAHFGGQRLPYDAVAERIKVEYLDRRLPYLTDYQVNQGVGIPSAQPATPELTFGVIAYAPATGGPGDEYFAITNPNDFAVDVSGWQISGSTHVELKPGTVIGANDSLYLTNDVKAFLTRDQAPGGQQGLFVQAYESALPNSGGVLVLLDSTGRQVDETRFGIATQPASPENLRISELNYNPPAGVVEFGELGVSGSNFEFVELVNVSDAPIDLSGVRFTEQVQDGNTEGIVFEFASQSLAAGERIVVAKNAAAFQSRYGTSVRLALGDDGDGGEEGQYGNRLGNGGETINLIDANGQLIQQITYDDAGSWPDRADGVGSSLEWIGAPAGPTSPEAWRASVTFGGTPGQAPSRRPSDVVVNEVLANSLAADADRIELFNSAEVTVDISGWYLSDQASNLWKFQVPENTVIAPQGFVVFDELQLGFGFQGGGNEDLWLVAVAANGHPDRFADVVELSSFASDQSIGRIPDGVGDFVALQSPTFGSSNGIDAQRGDLNADGTIDGHDLDLLCSAIISAETPDSHDIDGDGKVSEEDLDAMVHDLMKTSIGDANLDGVFDSEDIVQIMIAGRYRQADGAATWASGDWNCDGTFDERDLEKSFQDGGYQG